VLQRLLPQGKTSAAVRCNSRLKTLRLYITALFPLASYNSTSNMKTFVFFQ
jgi:hypothetical protein